MTKRAHQLLASLDSLALSKQEREDTRDVLQARMRFPHAFSTLESAARAFTLDPSEKLHARTELREAMHGVSVASDFRFLEHFSVNRFIAMVSASLALVGAGGGVLAYAAESALPGDLLYPVKVSVNEPVVTLLQHTPQEKARWAARKLERRLDEARVLVMQASPKQDTQATAKVRLDQPESTTTNTQATETAVVKAPIVLPVVNTRGLTGKQQEVLLDLLNAGVPDAKIRTWVTAVKGRREASQEKSTAEDIRGTDESSVSSVSSSARSSERHGKKKEIIRGVLESGFIGGRGSSKSRKNKYSSSIDAGALLSSDTDADASSFSSSTASSSPEQSSSESSSMSSASVSSSVGSASVHGDIKEELKKLLP